MKLVGRKITREVDYSAASTELFINPVTGAMRLSRSALQATGLAGKNIGIAYAESQNEDTYIYVESEGTTGGFKVADTGAITSKHHARELRDIFSPNQIEQFKVNVDISVRTFSEYPGIEFYRLYASQTAEVIMPEMFVNETIDEGISKVEFEEGTKEDNTLITLIFN